MSLSTFNSENEAAVKISTAHIRKISAHVATHLSEKNLYLFADDNGHAWHKSAYFDTNGNIITQKIPSVVTVPSQIRSIGNKFLDLYFNLIFILHHSTGCKMNCFIEAMALVFLAQCEVKLF